MTKESEPSVEPYDCQGAGERLDVGGRVVMAWVSMILNLCVW